MLLPLLRLPQAVPSGCGGAAVYRVVRQYANEIGPDVRDTWTTPQIEGVAEAILSGEVLAAAESAVGALK